MRDVKDWTGKAAVWANKLLLDCNPCQETLLESRAHRGEREMNFRLASIPLPSPLDSKEGAFHVVDSWLRCASGTS